jgi:hypothetical protein
VLLHAARSVSANQKEPTTHLQLSQASDRLLFSHIIPSIHDEATMMPVCFTVTHILHELARFYNSGLASGR